MNIKKISKEQLENFEFNSENLESAKRIIKRCYGTVIFGAKTK